MAAKIHTQRHTHCGPNFRFNPDLYIGYWLSLTIYPAFRYHPASHNNRGVVMQKIVFYADLLGFRTITKSNVSNAVSVLDEFYNLAQSVKVKPEYKYIDLYLFSDSLFAQADEKHLKEVVDFACELYRQCLMSDVSAKVFPVLLRGGIARGQVIIQKRYEAANVTKHFVVSEALVHGTEMEKMVKGQRLLLAANEEEEFKHFWKARYSAISYDAPSLHATKAFRDYKYHDILWARDLRQNLSIGKTTTKNCIERSASLFRDNYSSSKKVRQQYAETLRICLLSYTSLLEPNSNESDFLEALIDSTLMPYPDAVVWLGFLEMVCTSRDDFAFQPEVYMKKFMKFAIQHPEWGKICTALQLNEHAQVASKIDGLLSVQLNLQ